MIITNLSKLNNVWKLKQANINLIESIKTNYNLSNLSSQYLANKKIEFEEIQNYLNPTLKNNWIKAEDIPNIEYAKQTIISTIQNKEKIGIIGDYDVDGICSAIIMKELFEEFKIETSVWIPNRQDGYGPSQAALNFFEKNPVDLLILVDCGTTSHEFNNKYNKKILIIDHHHALNPIKNCVINPNATAEINISSKDKLQSLCATSLAFFITSSILKELKHKDYQKTMKSWLDLVALATICDVMPLNNLNRALVKAGIKQIEKQERIGLRQLINFANIKFPITTKDIAFAIGPRLNATGRIETPEISFNLLKTKSFEEADKLIHRIEMTNNYRKEIQNNSFQEALKIAKNESNQILCIANENWNPGIVGIVAAMIQEEESKPTIIGSIVNNEIKASARSKSVNIGMLIEKAVELSLLEKGGGHKAAAGLTCKIEKWQEFKEWINNQNIKIDQNIIEIDGIADLNEIEKDYKTMAPFGLGNEEPKVLVKNLHILKIIEKENYSLVILESNYKESSFFIQKSKQRLLEELKSLYQQKSTFSAVLNLSEKNNPTIEDIY
ncbi:single-stranded-DNA-specific exonuclease RecJ [Alphaproteobacteria bacterium endosymbiont of Tiliacea citrago]|uniref:single-stranded-DNA-specific exonuclease RecJ n=1 Tax=Alphaproteobacteria bacterium endosymbiont of Tiliacea citrago TaxID=3077944 RepID=UPI00313BA1EF